MNIIGLQEVVRKLREKAAKALADAEASVVVGYSQQYAIYVHENLEAHHPVGQAKFLEQPAREIAPKVVGMMKRSMREGKTFSQALILVALRIQRDSQLLCPVDSGALRASAFTRLEPRTNV